MNNLNVKLSIKGRGTVIMNSNQSPLEKLAAESDNEGGVQKTVSDNVAVPAAEPVMTKYAIGEAPPIEEPEGMVLPTQASGIASALKKSNKPGFDQNSVASAVSADEEHDGGIMANQTTYPVDDEGEQLVASGSNKDEQEHSNMYEVTGFVVQFHPKTDSTLGVSKGIASVAVRDYYMRLEDAMERVVDDTYLMPMDIKARISSGAPVICFNDRQKFEYINSAWRKL